ncbi:F-box domain-containing protein [Mycena kentingensis (nom. inval.)]|nr:F-box domain-containing protein [Mycena kentingensis (nom. inval.)]
MSSLSSRQLPDSAPILSLPPELLAEIFCSFIPLYPETPRPNEPDSPLHLTAVCRTWRQVSCTTPALWRAVAMRAPDGEVSGSYPHLRILNTFLQRSGACPLALRLFGQPSGQLEELINAILLHRPRWEYVRVNVDEVTLPRVVSLGAPMSLLKSLGLVIYASAQPQVPPEAVPNLTSLYLWDPAPDTGADAFPWRQLTRLRLRNVSLRQCVEILPLAVDLRFLCLKVSGDDTWPGGRKPTFVFPRLEVLILEAAEIDGYTLLARFTLPALRRLQIEGTWIETEQLLNVPLLIARSKCALEQLRISRRAVNSDEVIDGVWQGLKTVYIDAVSDEDDWIPELLW